MEMVLKCNWGGIRSAEISVKHVNTDLKAVKSTMALYRRKATTVTTIRLIE